MTKTGLVAPFTEESDTDQAIGKAWNRKAMDIKGNKQKKKQVMISNDENVIKNRRQPWPDLPDQLIKLISKQFSSSKSISVDDNGLPKPLKSPPKRCNNPNPQSSLLQSISFDGVIKTWRSPSRKCNNPNQQFSWLDLITDRESADHKMQNVYSIPELPLSNGWWFRRWGPNLSPEDPIVGSSYGELVMRQSNKSPFQYKLWNRNIWCIPLPCDENVPFRRIILSNPLLHKTNPTVLVLTGGPNPGIMFSNTLLIGYFTWIKVECSNILEPNVSSGKPNSTIEFTNAVFFMDKFYVLSLQGTLAVIDIDSDSDIPPRVRILGAKRAIPSVWSRSFKEYLVESNGDMLLVFLIYRKSTNIVDDFEVFRLDFENMSWVKMESLGDRTLFVGTNCFMPVCASELGCQANCIYFTQHGLHNDGWWVFDMESGIIRPGWNGDSIDKSPTWIT